MSEHDDINTQLRQNAIDTLKDLPPEDRLMVFAEFCVHCGDITPPDGCSCWRDE